MKLIIILLCAFEILTFVNTIKLKHHYLKMRERIHSKAQRGWSPKKLRQSHDRLDAVKYLYNYLQETIYLMIYTIDVFMTDSEEEKLAKAFGVIDMLKIKNMLLYGKIEPITISERNSAKLAEICSSKTFVNPLVIYESAFRSSGGCRIEYHVRTHSLLLTPYNPITSVSITKNHPPSYKLLSEMGLKKLNARFSDGKFPDRFLENIISGGKLRDLDINLDVLSPEQLDSLLRGLESPRNKVKRLVLRFMDAGSRPELIQNIESAFRSKYFKPDELHLPYVDRNNLIRFLNVVRHKVKLIGTIHNPSEDVVALINDARSSITSLIIGFDYNYPDLNGFENALTARPNKITHLEVTELPDLDYWPRLIQKLTLILKSPNNKLNTLIVQIIEWEDINQNVWNDFLLALQSPYCKLKYLRIAKDPNLNIIANKNGILV